MKINVTFVDEQFPVKFVDETNLVPNFGEIVRITDPALIPYYTGSYNIIPIAWDSIVLSSKDKMCINNITIQPIPFSATPNAAGGLTISIG